jgi:hypothetical protein
MPTAHRIGSFGDSMRVTHLNKSGSGFTSMTACGRNLLRTPISVNWTEFKSDAYKCVKCVNSKQANLNTRVDAKKEVSA